MKCVPHLKPSYYIGIIGYLLPNIKPLAYIDFAMHPEFIAFTDKIESAPKASVAEIAFVGRSNAGKSSLINTLLKQKIARTSSTPGRTQGLCFFKVKPNLIFVDFPGFGYAKTSKTLREQWAGLAEDYYKKRRTLKGTVWIYDIRRDPDELDDQMKEWLTHGKKPFFLILTKCDRIKRGEWEQRRRKIAEVLEISEENVIIFSSKTKEGYGKLWKYLESKI